MSIEEKMEADGRSIYVGNVSNTVSYTSYFGLADDLILDAVVFKKGK